MIGSNNRGAISGFPPRLGIVIETGQSYSWPCLGPLGSAGKVTVMGGLSPTDWSNAETPPAA